MPAEVLAVKVSSKVSAKVMAAGVVVAAKVLAAMASAKIPAKMVAAGVVAAKVLAAEMPAKVPRMAMAVPSRVSVCGGVASMRVASVGVVGGMTKGNGPVPRVPSLRLGYVQVGMGKKSSG